MHKFTKRLMRFALMLLNDLVDPLYTYLQLFKCHIYIKQQQQKKN